MREVWQIGNTVNLVISTGMQGFAGAIDILNQQYSVQAKQSLWATPEENSQLANDLLEVYKLYLKGIANRNNGFY